MFFKSCIFFLNLSVFFSISLFPIPKMLKEIWQKTARKESRALLNNINRLLGDSRRFHEFIDSQGNYYFRNKNGKLLATAALSPFRRPASARNSEYYYERMVFLWEKKRRREAVEILKELISLSLYKNEKDYATGFLYKSLALKFYNSLKQKYSSRFENLWNKNHIILTENLNRKEFQIKVSPAFFSARLPNTFSLRMKREKHNKEKSLYYFIFDSREDYLLKQTEWEIKKKQEKNLFSLQEIYDYFSGKKPLKSELENFQFQISGILYRFNYRTPSDINSFQKLIWHLKGLDCKNGFCRRGSTLYFNYKTINSTLNNSVQLQYNRPVIIRGKKVSLYNEEVFLLKKDFGYYFLLESIPESKKKSQKNYYDFLQNISINL